MPKERAKNLLLHLFQTADIRLNGSRPWDICVHDEAFYGRVLREGSFGFGESYVDGWWDAGAVDELVYRIRLAELDRSVRTHWRLAFPAAWEILTNPQRKSKAFEIGERHYDLGNDLFQAMLDRRMVYTCAYWKDAATLDEAQEAKLELVCRKIGLREGQKILDIGCGFGSFAKYAAEKYGATVVGVTVSKQQAELGSRLCAGLPVEIRLQDYRDVNEPFDHLVSLGMFEHVGYKNYRTYMELARRNLRDEGLFLLQTIGSNLTNRTMDSWVQKHIFPGGILPSVRQIAEAVERLFIIEDWHNFGADYDKTLTAWHANFHANWKRLEPQYGERFHRTWRYYLLAFAGSFRARHLQLWQILLSKRGVPGGVVSIR